VITVIKTHLHRTYIGTSTESNIGTKSNIGTSTESNIGTSTEEPNIGTESQIGTSTHTQYFDEKKTKKHGTLTEECFLTKLT